MNTHLKPITYPAAGAPVFVEFLGVLRHYGIVSDRWSGGAPMVISNSWRSGQTREEPWGTFGGGKTVYLATRLQSRLSVHEIVRRAHAWGGRPYDVLSRNCDHHVRHSLGLPVISPQIRAGLFAAGALFLVGALALPTARNDAT